MQEVISEREFCINFREELREEFKVVYDEVVESCEMAMIEKANIKYKSVT